MRRDERGQSEVVGTLLLVAVIVVAATAVGTFVLLSLSDEPAPPRVELSAAVDESDVTVTHEAGEPLDLRDIQLVVRHGDQQQTLDFESGRLEPGESVTRAHGLTVTTGDRVDVVVVHVPTRTVLLDANRVVG